MSDYDFNYDPTGGFTGSNTTIRPPDTFNFYITVEGDIYGDGGQEEFAQKIVDALIYYTDIGHNVNVIFGEQ